MTSPSVDDIVAQLKSPETARSLADATPGLTDESDAIAGPVLPPEQESLAKSFLTAPEASVVPTPAIPMPASPTKEQQPDEAATTPRESTRLPSDITNKDRPRRRRKFTIPARLDAEGLLLAASTHDDSAVDDDGGTALAVPKKRRAFVAPARGRVPAPRVAPPTALAGEVLAFEGDELVETPAATPAAAPENNDEDDDGYGVVVVGLRSKAGLKTTKKKKGGFRAPGGRDDRLESDMQYQPHDALVLLPSPYPKARVHVPPLICQFLRPHQREGVQFLFDCVSGRRAYPDHTPLRAKHTGAILVRCLFAQFA